MKPFVPPLFVCLARKLAGGWILRPAIARDRYSRSMLSPLFESRLEDLLAAWRHHNDLRRQRRPIAELAQARENLDRMRKAAYEVRRALNPELREVDEALATTYCAAVDETVFLFATDAIWDGPGPLLRCICGKRVESPHASAPSSPAGHGPG